MMKNACSCIIPFYNEARRVIETIKMVKSIKNIEQIICVDDASTDNAKEEIIKLFPKLKIISLKENKGKTAAVSAGLKLVKTEYVLILDADLKNHNPSEFYKGIQYLLDNPSYDLLVFRQHKAPLVTYLTASNVVLSGQRIIKTKLLTKILSQGITGYQMEVAINKYCLDHQKKVVWINFSSKNTFKIKKRGLKVGLIQDMQMIKDTMCFGLANYFRQVWFFKNKRIPEEKLFYRLRNGRS